MCFRKPYNKVFNLKNLKGCFITELPKDTNDIKVQDLTENERQEQMSGFDKKIYIK